MNTHEEFKAVQRIIQKTTEFSGMSDKSLQMYVLYLLMCEIYKIRGHEEQKAESEDFMGMINEVAVEVGRRAMFGIRALLEDEMSKEDQDG